MMKHGLAILGTAVFFVCGCGQRQLVLPEGTAGNACGPGYPALEPDGGGTYDLETGAVSPCLLFASAELNGEPGYIHFTDLHLKAKHGQIDATSVVIVVSAENCPSCAVFMADLSERVTDFEAAGAIMIAGVWCDNVDRDNCGFDLETAVSVAESEGWPTDRWWVTNDAEGQLKPTFSETFPSAIVVRLSDMNVVLVDRLPTVAGLFEAVSTL